MRAVALAVALAGLSIANALKRANDIKLYIGPTGIFDAAIDLSILVGFGVCVIAGW